MGIKDPTRDYHAANKKYVDNLNNQNVKLAGDQSIGGNKTFTQPITIPTPTADTHATTKAYVDNAIQNITPGSGGSIDTSNFATLNTAQIITGAKTFDNNVVIRKDGTPLALRAVNPGKIYMLMKGADDNTNFSLGADSSNTSLEVNRGDLTINTQQANKNVNFTNVAIVKFNRSILEMGTEINAGFGGGEVKFIPEDNSTKTLKFYNNNPTDQRRFNLLVPEPTQAQNPATKQYVDNAIAGINTSGNVPQQTLDQINNNTNNITTLQGKVNTNTTNITTIRNNYLDKTATGVQQIAGKIYLNNQLFVNTQYNPNLTPNGDFHVTGQGYIENLEADNATFNTSVIVPTPTQNNQAANKQYVDNKTGLYTMFSSNTIYNNLQKITTRLFDNSAVDYLKPLTVSFTRTNTSGTDYGSYTFQIQYGIGENNFVVGSNLYYDRSKTYGQLGDWVALTITPSYIQVQCWGNNDRIKNIKVQGWKKV